MLAFVQDQWAPTQCCTGIAMVFVGVVTVLRLACTASFGALSYCGSEFNEVSVLKPKRRHRCFFTFGPLRVLLGYPWLPSQVLTRVWPRKFRNVP